MASVRFQMFDAIEAKLQDVRDALGWNAVLRDPRNPVGEDQMNALLLATGADLEPDALTGQVQAHTAEFSVGMVVLESEAASAEVLLDTGFVAVCDALEDPADMQLGGLIVGLWRGGLSPAFIGLGEEGGRIIGVQEIQFRAQYWTREGDVSSPGP